MLSAAGSNAQTGATLRGFVTDASDGQPLIGVNVVLTANDGTLFGMATDSDGFYTIAQVPPAGYAVRASFIGYLPFESEIELAAGELARLDVRLSPSAEVFDEVVVEAESNTAGAASLTAGLQSVRPVDIERIPVPGVSPDLAAYITKMPGVISSGDRGGQLFIRGGTPTQNAVFLDGMLLYQPFHILGFYSAFPSEIVSSADVYAGGFGSEFGGRISSVIDVATRTGNKRGFAGSASFSPFMATGRVEGPIVPGSVSFLVSVRESLVDDLGDDLVGESMPYTFGDAFGKLHANLSEGIQASISAISTHDRGFIVPTDDIPPELLGRSDQVSWVNQAVGARYLVLPSSLPILAEILLSYSRLENEFGPEEAPERSSKVSRSGAAVNFSYFMRTIDMKFGLSVHSITLDNNLGGQFQSVDDSKEFVTEGAAYLETEIKGIPGVRVTLGSRAQTFPSVGHSSIEPRFKAIWQTGPHQLSAAGGLFTQEIVGLNDRRDAGDVFTAWTVSERGLPAPEARHAILGYRLTPSRYVEMSIEGFYKDLGDLVIPEWTAFPRFTTNLQPADGTAKGLDFRFEYDRRPFYGHVTYGLSDVDYKARQASLPVWYGSSSVAFNPPHDRTHQLNVLGSLHVSGFKFSAQWQFGSGLPYSQAAGFDDYILISDTFEEVDVRVEPGQERVIYGQPYGDRLPDYQRLDLSVERTFAIGRRVSSTFQAGVINALDRDNLFYLDLFTLARVDQLPRFPSFGIKMEFK
ncbi:MAG TPA: TonB-dependent receptor [Rhodothermales bacterium]